MNIHDFTSQRDLIEILDIYDPIFTIQAGFLVYRSATVLVSWQHPRFGVRSSSSVFHMLGEQVPAAISISHLNSKPLLRIHSKRKI